MSAAQRDSLQATAVALGLTLADAQIDALLQYLELLRRWNATYNLTAVRDPAAMLTHHLADCLAVIEPLRRDTANLPASVLDVGSGGGLPAVVIAATLPSLSVTSVDTVGKKAAFVRQVAAELQLPNLRALHARVETVTTPGFDVIVSRAFASLADFVRLSGHALNDSGRWMAMKGRTPEEEMHALPPSVEVFHVEPLTVPGLSAERCLVWIRRKAPSVPSL